MNILRKSLALVLILAVMVPVTVALAAENDLVIAFVPQQVGITYFEAANKGAQRAAEELGVEVYYVGPTEIDAVSQANVVSDLINQKVDAICIQPTDSESILPVLNKAMEAGIKVVTWGCDVDPAYRNAFVNSINYTDFGYTMTDKIAEAMNEEGEFAIITSALTAVDCAAWVEACKVRIAEQYPKMTLLTVEPCDDDQAKAYSIAQNLLTAYPNIKGILGVTSPAPPAAAQAVTDAGKIGEIAVVGASEPSMSNAYLKTNAIYCSVLWDIEAFGELSVKVANAVLNGEEITDGYVLKNWGPITIKDDEIVLGDPLIITAENVDSFNF
ncbi:MAG: autoinducer 2 ABC transporter substrate-binding protein [Clostridia bacterium]